MKHETGKNDRCTVQCMYCSEKLLELVGSEIVPRSARRNKEVLRILYVPFMYVLYLQQKRKTRKARDHA